MAATADTRRATWGDLREYVQWRVQDVVDEPRLLPEYIRVYRHKGWREDLRTLIVRYEDLLKVGKFAMNTAQGHRLLLCLRRDPRPGGNETAPRATGLAHLSMVLALGAQTLAMYRWPWVHDEPEREARLGREEFPLWLHTQQVVLLRIHTLGGAELACAAASYRQELTAEVHKRNRDNPEPAALRYTQLVCPQPHGPPHRVGFPHLPVIDMQTPAGRLDCYLTFPVAPPATRAQATLKEGLHVLGQFDEALRSMAALLAVDDAHQFRGCRSTLNKVLAQMLPRRPHQDWQSGQLDLLLRNLRHLLECYEEAWEVYVLQPPSGAAAARGVDLEAWSQLVVAFRDWSVYCQDFLARPPVIDLWSSADARGAPDRLVQLWVALHTPGTPVSERAAAYAPPGTTTNMQVAHQAEQLLPNACIAWASSRGRAGIECPGAELFEWMRAFWRLVHDGGVRPHTLLRRSSPWKYSRMMAARRRKQSARALRCIDGQGTDCAARPLLRCGYTPLSSARRRLTKLAVLTLLGLTSNREYWF